MNEWRKHRRHNLQYHTWELQDMNFKTCFSGKKRDQNLFKFKHRNMTKVACLIAYWIFPINTMPDLGRTNDYFMHIFNLNCSLMKIGECNMENWCCEPSSVKLCLFSEGLTALTGKHPPNWWWNMKHQCCNGQHEGHPLIVPKKFISLITRAWNLPDLSSLSIV